MERSFGMPAVGRTTMLGLQLAKPLEYTSWLSVLPTTTSITPQKPSNAVTASFRSPSKTSHEPHQINSWENLNACLERHGAMDSFHTLFDRSLFDNDTINCKTEDITTSLWRPRTPGTPDWRASSFKEYALKTATDTSDLDAGQSTVNLTAPSHEHVSPCAMLPSLGSGKGTMVPFRSLFPGRLLSDKVDGIPDTEGNSIPVLEQHPLCYLHGRTLCHDCQIPDHEILGNTFTTTESKGIGPLNLGTPNKEHDGRISPQPSTSTGESCSTLDNSPNSSRRSSWATSISTHLGEDDDDDSDFADTNIPVKPDQNTDGTQPMHEYQHYCQLIELGDPKNRRDRDFMAQKPVEEVIYEVATPEFITQATDDLAGEASGHTACVDPKTSTMQAQSGPGEQGMRSEGTCIQPERMQPDSRPTLGSDSDSAPPATPAEAAAWAHSYCDVAPESMKLKVLTDDSGREYVLYRDCFHCVPIELATEFVEVAEEEQEEDDDDDGYGSANETCEAARDDVKLGTIPEEEDEG